jgi:hypothetical protein
VLVPLNFGQSRATESGVGATKPAVADGAAAGGAAEGLVDMPVTVGAGQEVGVMV